MNDAAIPVRKDVPAADRWDLSRLFASDAAWEEGLARYVKMAERLPAFKGTLGTGAAALAAYLDFARDLGILEERLAYYSNLRQSEDEGDDISRGMGSRFVVVRARTQAASAWVTPEIQAIPDADMERFLQDGRLAEYRVYLHKLLRWKPYILSEKEERLIALEDEAADLAQDAFSVLTNVDIDFGTVETAAGPKALSQSTWSVFMESPDRALRKRAYEQFYGHYERHKTTLATLYAGSVKRDVIAARIRGFPSARAAALFGNNVSESVYDNLVSTIHEGLPHLHRYYALRKRLLKLDTLRHYDVYTSIAPEAAKAVTRRRGWEEAVELVAAALAPLGAEYVDTLRAGLLGRWADRYENRGKRSGAFSAGSFTGEPYILMNYKDDSVRDIFTIAHEGGHSMHSWYSARSNPFMQYSYTIFEAEVASTFNEDLLFRYLRDHARSAEERLYYVNRRADELLATLYRQTMFAEFEKRSHELEEAGEALTVAVLRAEYRKLLETYFGSEMTLEETSDLEGLRIPHFYNAFYVYKYATGISASLALAERVLSGGEAEKRDYFAFLTSGGSRFPIDALKVAGVDMSSPAPVKAACAVFAGLVDELERLTA